MVMDENDPSFGEWDEQGGNGVSLGSSAGLIGTAIQTGAALYDSYQNRKTARENTDKNIAAAKSESELAYQRSMQQWDAQNQYNSPAAQMARFTKAGLNPHLIYGQGSAGNASSPPQYQPANLQYHYQAPAYGAAISSILPTLMAVGTWMQNMRLSEAELEKKTTDTDRVRQLVEFLTERNPQVLRESENRQSLFPYQKQAASYNTNISRTKLFELEQEFRNKYGEGLFTDLGSAWEPQGGKYHDIGGLKRLQFLQEVSKTKLLDAKSSWSEFNITDPQHIIQMVLSGVMGLAGQSMRLRSNSLNQTTRSRVVPPSPYRPRSLQRIHPSRRVQYGD